MCYNCGIPGHYRSECLAPPRCYICRNEPHTATECIVQPRPYVLEMLGHGIKDQGFFTSTWVRRRCPFLPTSR